MGKVVCICLALVLVFAPTPLQKAKANGYADASSVCLFISENNKTRLRKLIKELRIKLRSLYQDMTCNGETLLQFAMTSNAADVGKFLVKKIPVSVLKEKGDLEWAAANGHADSEIALAISERIGS